MDTKKTIKAIIIIIILIILVLGILYLIKSKNYAKTDELGDLKNKVSQEIYFLDDYLISIANSINNINLENYIIKVETITGQSSKESNKSGDSSSSENSEGESSKEGSESGSASQKEGNSSGENSSAYVLEPSDVLVNDRNADWESIKIAVERLYSAWTPITMDLYKLEANIDTINEFSKNLDELTKNVKAEDKASTLASISMLYENLINFGELTMQDLEKNIIKTKSNIVNAYTLIEAQKWDEMKEYLKRAEEEYIKVMNDDNNKNRYNVNKTYISLKEFQTSIDAHDSDVLYIKYKNLLDEINIINI